MDPNSLSTETHDVDKSLFDAEQFLSNFTSLRDECERLKAENHELQLQLQQLNQDHGQLQIDKQNLERHIQKEALRHKEVVWNLKIEVQKSQEERLAWKEKFLDLCIKSSQNNVVLNSNAILCGTEKKAAKKTRTRKNTRKKPDVSLQQQKPEQQRDQHQQETQQQQQEHMEIRVEDDIQVQVSTQVEELGQSDAGIGQCGTELRQCDMTNSQEVAPPQSSQVDDGLALQTTLSEETANINRVEMVANSLDGKFEQTSDIPQAHVVTTDTADYYSIQPAQFNLDSQGQPVSGGNTTTFILQTSDATFCATAVMDDQQRAHFNNAPSGVPFELKTTSTSFTNESNSATGFSQPIIAKYNSENSDSEENTEFNYRCSMCNFTYSEQSGLDKHIKAKHSAKTNLCKECGKAYSTKGSLAQHVHHYHRHPMAYSCEICEKKFNRKDFLVKHIKTHTQERTFPCTHCDKQFKTNASLSAHVNGSHNEKRRFVCDFCGMRTSWRLSYLEHMKLHTGEPRKAAANAAKKKLKEEMAEEQLAMNEHQLDQQNLDIDHIEHIEQQHMEHQHVEHGQIDQIDQQQQIEHMEHHIKQQQLEQEEHVEDHRQNLQEPQTDARPQHLLQQQQPQQEHHEQSHQHQEQQQQHQQQHQQQQQQQQQQQHQQQHRPQPQQLVQHMQHQPQQQGHQEHQQINLQIVKAQDIQRIVTEQGTVVQFIAPSNS